VPEEESREGACPDVGDTGADHPGQREVEAGLAGLGIRPVDHDRPTRGEEHVLRMQIEMKEALALIRDLVQAVVQRRERAGVAGEPPRAPAQVGRHRRPVHELEDERVVAHLENLGYREAVRSRVLHDGCLARRIAVSHEGAENAAVAEVEDLGGAPGRKHSHGRSIRLRLA
jgi:hypothetical protein